MAVLAATGYTWWQTFDIFLMAGLVIVFGIPIVMLFAKLDRWMQERRISDQQRQKQLLKDQRWERDFQERKRAEFQELEKAEERMKSNPETPEEDLEWVRQKKERARQQMRSR